MANVGVGVHLPLVTFDLCNTPPTLTLALPKPSTSVNKLKDPGAIESSVRLEGSLYVCEGLVIVCCSSHPGSGSYNCVGGVAEWH